MRRDYSAPELEIVTIKLSDVLVESVYESSISEVIGGGGGEEPAIDIEL